MLYRRFSTMNVVYKSLFSPINIPTGLYMHKQGKEISEIAGGCIDKGILAICRQKWK